MVKKLLAIILAVAIAASIAVTGFADEQIYDGVAGIFGNQKPAVIVRYGTDNFYYINGTDDCTADFGDSVFLILKNNSGQINPSAWISDKEIVDGLKVKAIFEQGEELVESIGTVKTRFETDANITPELAPYIGKYYYAVEIKLVDRPDDANERDLFFTLEFDKSKKGSWDYADHSEYDIDGDGEINFKVKDLKVDVAFSVGRSIAHYNDIPGMVIDSGSLGGKIHPMMFHIFKYDYDDELEFEFGTEPNEGSFTVDVSGQGKTVIYYNTNLDDSVAAANPGAALMAVNFNGCKFNRVGVFSYESEKMNYAYAIRGGQLVKIGKFENDVFEYNTRILERYIFSDVELIQPQGEIAEMTYEVQW